VDLFCIFCGRRCCRFTRHDSTPFPAGSAPWPCGRAASCPGLEEGPTRPALSHPPRRKQARGTTTAARFSVLMPVRSHGTRDADGNDGPIAHAGPTERWNRRCKRQRQVRKTHEPLRPPSGTSHRADIDDRKFLTYSCVECADSLPFLHLCPAEMVNPVQRKDALSSGAQRIPSPMLIPAMADDASPRFSQTTADVPPPLAHDV
jgi:hypothetical protein